MGSLLDNSVDYQRGDYDRTVCACACVCVCVCVCTCTESAAGQSLIQTMSVIKHNGGLCGLAGVMMMTMRLMAVRAARCTRVVPDGD